MFKPVAITLMDFRPNPRTVDGARFIDEVLSSSYIANPDVTHPFYYQFLGYAKDDKGQPMVVVDGKDPICFIFLNSNMVDYVAVDPYSLQGREIQVNPQDFLNVQRMETDNKDKFPVVRLAFNEFSLEPTEEMKSARREILKHMIELAWKEREEKIKNWRETIAEEIKAGLRGPTSTQNPAPTLASFLAGEEQPQGEEEQPH